MSLCLSNFSDFIVFSGDFPLKFFSVRWVESIPVAKRLIHLWPHLVLYIEEVKKRTESKQPTCASFKVLCEAVNDPLTLEKLHTFVAIANEFNGYLVNFQANKPMAPLMYEGIKKIIHSLMSRFVSQKVLEDKLSLQCVQKLDFDDSKNTKPPQKISLYFEISEALKQSKCSESQVIDFKRDFKNILMQTTKHTINKSSIKYDTIFQLDCFNPKSIVGKTPYQLRKKLNSLLSSFVTNKYIESSECDAIIDQYMQLQSQASNGDLRHKFEDFNLVNDRLDEFYWNLLTNQPTYVDKMWPVLKIIMILSHGQADVERGFSINKQLLEDNMKEKSIVCNRIVTDACMVSVLNKKYL